MTSQSRKPKFENSARRWQGDFRENSDTISTEGRSPSDNSGLRNRHLLAVGYGEENLYSKIRGRGGAVDFFVNRRLKWWNGNGDAGGPTRNMASSQVACVNFLLPLARIPSALLAIIRAIDDDVRAIVDKTTKATSHPLSSSGSA